MTVNTDLVTEYLEGYMASAFSKKEKEEIYNKLHKTAKECLQKYGVKKTTVDQIVSIAGISKGSFYNFYPTKETLFFRVLEEYQIDSMKRLIYSLGQEKKVNANKLVQLLYDTYQDFRYSFAYTIFENHEIDLLTRKLPKEIISAHHLLDDNMVEKIVSKINLKENISIDTISALLRAIAMSMLHIEEIGKKQFNPVLKLLIKGVVYQIIDEE